MQPSSNGSMARWLNGPIVLALFFLPECVYAQSDTIKEQYMQPVEVRAVRVGNNAPFVKTDLSAKDIDQQNLGQDLPVLLQYTPSVVTTSDAGAGVGYTGIHIRGTDATRINVTMNGIPVNDPEEQATYFVDVPDIASSTASIQIQRGVGISTNGAGAFGATIGIDNLQQFDSAGAILNSSFGSFNTWKNTLRAGTGLLKNGWQFDVRLSKITSDGYIQRSNSDLKSLQFTGGWKASPNTSLHFMVMTGTEKTGQAWNGVPQDSLSTNRTYNGLGLKADGSYYNNQTDNYQQDYYQFFIDHKFSPTFTAHVGLFLTRGKGYYEEYVQSDMLSNYGITNAAGDSTALIRQLWLDNYYYGSVFSLLWQKNKTQFTIGGAATQFENLHYGIIKWTSNGGAPDNYEWYRNDAQKNDFNLYAKLQQQLGEKLFLFADMQMRTLAYFINGYDDNPAIRKDVNYNFFNPKAGITCLLRNTWNEKQKIYASVAVAHREANRADFETDSVYLPKAEALTDIEAGYEVNKLKWSFSINGYYMSYKNQLVLTGQINDVGAYTQTNVPNSYRAGIELEGAAKLNSFISVNGNATLSQNKIKTYTEYVDNYDNGGQDPVTHNNTDIAFAPDFVGALTISINPFTDLPKGKHFTIDVFGKYVGNQYLDNTEDADRSLSAYGYINMLVRYSIKCKPFKEIELKLALNNISNRLYSTNGYTYSYIETGIMNTSNWYFPQAGFNLLGGITLKW
jgi:iron complex outermembrane receptor protein